MERLTWWQRLRRINPLIADGTLAALVLLLTLLGTSFGPDLSHRRGFDALAFGLVVLSSAPLMFRRRWPLPVLEIVGAAAVTYAAFEYRNNLVLPLALAAYTAAANEERHRVLTLVMPVAVVAAIATQVGTGHGFNWVEIVVGVTFAVGIPIAFGRSMFNRRRRLRAERDRAAHDAVVEERARIARELHDIVAHAMSVMVVQAGAARTVVDADPGEAKLALRRIEETGRSGLTEMRRLIGVLKADGDGATLVPQPGLDQLALLLETLRNAGLSVEAVLEGTSRPLPPGIDLTAYRFVQEGLTNVLKHAGAAHAFATVRYSADALELEVADDGHGPSVDLDAAAGHGLIGMRERVALFDGTLEVGQRPGGGFRLRARIPLGTDAVS